jgi:hypothetical protein
MRVLFRKERIKAVRNVINNSIATPIQRIIEDFSPSAQNFIPNRNTSGENSIPYINNRNSTDALYQLQGVDLILPENIFDDNYRCLEPAVISQQWSQYLCQLKRC